MQQNTPAPLSETLATPLSLAMGVYIAIGFSVVGFVIIRGLKLRRTQEGTPSWDTKSNAHNGLFLFQVVLLKFPIAFIIELLLWPLLLLFMWAYQSDDEEDDETI